MTTPLNQSLLRAARELGLVRWLPVIILLVAALLRFHNLGEQSYWNDEGNTLRLVGRALPDLIAAAGRDIHPPGYYLLLKAWHSLTGDTEFALRAFSALCGLLTVACVYQLGKLLFAAGAGVVAAFLLAINSFSVYYGQEARMYALLALVAVAALLALSRWLLHQKPAAALLLALLNALGLYVHYSYPFLMLGQGLVFLLYLARRRNRASLLTFIALNLITIALFAPQLATAIGQISGWQQANATPPPDHAPLTLLAWFSYGNTFAKYGEALSLLSFGYIFIFAVAGSLPGWHTGTSNWRRVGFLVPIIVLIGCIVFFFLFGLYREGNLKFLLPAQAFFALWLGRGVWLLWSVGSPNLFLPQEAWPRLLAVLGLISIFNLSSDALNNLYADPRFARDNYRAIAQKLLAGARASDLVILNAPNQAEVFSYYYPGPVLGLPQAINSDDAATEAEVKALLTSGAERIFVLYWGDAERDPRRVVEKTLAAHSYEVNSAWYGDVRLVQYAVPGQTGPYVEANQQFGETITLLAYALNGQSQRPGNVLTLALRWQSSQRLATRYRVTVQLLNQQGGLAAQRDAEPGNNMAITTVWQPNTPIDDAHGLLLPANLPPGRYQLIVALYELENPAVRLSIASNGQTALVLAEIDVR
jgi:mannosyltransferase